MAKNNSGYAIPITIAVAVVTIVGGSFAGWGKIRSEIQKSIENELKAQTRDVQSTGYDDSQVLARLEEMERNHSAVAKGIADLKEQLERLSVPRSNQYDDSQLRERLDRLE